MKQSTATVIGGGICAAAIVGLLVASTIHERQDDVIACPAIGRVTTVDVHITGDASLVHDVRLCTTGGCSAPAAAEVAREDAEASSDQDSAPPAAGLPAAPTEAETPSPVLPTGAPGAKPFPAPTYLDDVGTPPGQWSFETGERYPTEVSVTAYGANGGAVASRVVDLGWHREFPQDVCRAWLVTRPVTLAVAS